MNGYSVANDAGLPERYRLRLPLQYCVVRVVLRYRVGEQFNLVC